MITYEEEQKEKLKAAFSSSSYYYLIGCNMYAGAALYETPLPEKDWTPKIDQNNVKYNRWGGNRRLVVIWHGLVEQASNTSSQ